MLTETATAPEGLTLHNPSQAEGTVWGYRQSILSYCVLEARALNPLVFEKIFLTYVYPAFHKKCPIFLRKRRPVCGVLFGL